MYVCIRTAGELARMQMARSENVKEKYRVELENHILSRKLSRWKIKL